MLRGRVTRRISFTVSLIAYRSGKDVSAVFRKSARSITTGHFTEHVSSFQRILRENSEGVRSLAPDIINQGGHEEGGPPDNESLKYEQNSASPSPEIYATRG